MPTLGKNGAFIWNTKDMSGDGNNLAMDVSVDVLEATVFGKNWKVYKEGLASAQFTYNAFWTSTTDHNDPVAYAAIGNQPDGLAFSYKVDKGTAGGIQYSGAIIMDRWSVNSRPADLITLQASFRVTDLLTRTVL